MQICILKSEFLGLEKIFFRCFTYFPRQCIHQQGYFISYTSCRTVSPTDVSPTNIIWFSEWIFLTEKHGSEEDYKIKYFYKTTLYSNIYMLYMVREVIKFQTFLW